MNRAFLFAASTFGSFAAGAALLLSPATAAAQDGLAACGNIDVEANASCKVEVAGGCKAKCTPVSFRAACEAKIEGSGCNVAIDATCNLDCKAELEAACTANPGSLDCDASCTGSCSGNCDAECSAGAGGSGAQADCKARCEGSCNARCSASCTGQGPEVSCQARAEASCKGRCEAKANVDCDLKAQVKCEADLKGGCEVQCEKPEGALYCDGQFVDTGNSLQQCISGLEAFLTSKVDVSARASASCATMGPSSGLGSMGFIAGGVGLAAMLRRRRNRAS